MIFTSASRSPVNLSNVARATPRRAASGHRRSIQFLKSATAPRMASGIISGWPDAPGSPLHLSDGPLIQHVVDEAREAGIEHFIFVTGRNKNVIEDHFDRQIELETTLRERNKSADLALLEEELPAPGNTTFTRQQSPLGLGHAVWCARELVGNEPFALLLPDMLVKGKPGCLAQMIDAYKVLGEDANLIAVEE